MIDFYDAEFNITPPPELCRRLLGSNPHAPWSQLKTFVNHPDWMTRQRALIKRESIRLLVCPSKVLGSWNCHGSNNLRELVVRTAPLVLNALGVPVPPELQAQIAAGEYRLREVHVAETFGLPRFDQTEVIDRLFYALSRTHKPQRAQRGQGLVIKPQNRRCSVYVYDKLREFNDRGLPEYRQRMAACSCGWRRLGLWIDRQKQVLMAAAGPRLELRFGDKFFASSPLARGDAWAAGTAARLFRAELQALRWPQSLTAVFDRDVAKTRLTGAEFSTLLHWQHGEDLASLLSLSTLKRHRQAILDALRIDIRQPAATSLGARRHIAVGRLFSAQNVVGVGDLDLDAGPPLGALRWGPLKSARGRQQPA